ncbi:MAG: DUF192 domain-containing protein [Pseudomonadota bacterium]
MSPSGATFGRSAFGLARRRAAGPSADARLRVCVVMSSLLAVILAAGAPPAAADGPTCAVDRVIVEAAGGPVLYTVEIADEPAEHAEGLMFRTEMASDAGMLFLFETPRQASFWMRNTFISLDMIFIAPGGTVLNVAENTVPFSEAPQYSDGAAAAVLEVNAGEAARHGIGPGTATRHPTLTPDACE